MKVNKPMVATKDRHNLNNSHKPRSDQKSGPSIRLLFSWSGHMMIVRKKLSAVTVMASGLWTTSRPANTMFQRLIASTTSWALRPQRCELMILRHVLIKASRAVAATFTFVRATSLAVKFINIGAILMTLR